MCTNPPPHHETCFYCTGKDCENGCSSSANCPDLYPICGHGGAQHACGCTHDDDCKSGYLCDVSAHKCYAPPGKVLLDSIKIYTSSCTGCDSSDEGIVVRLLGERNGAYIGGVPCATNVLDHSASQDFGQGAAAFDGRKHGNFDEEEEVMMGSCFEAALNSQLTSGGNVTWVGAGSWSPSTEAGICVDWRDPVAFPWVCDLQVGVEVGQWTFTNCRSLLPQTECP